ncbi:MAG: hypothetical protein RLN81_10810 [Balneolaceae bacterium]
MNKLVYKFLIVIGIILIYFSGIRVFRGIVHDIHMGIFLPEEYGIVSDDLIFYSQSSVSFTFESVGEEIPITWQYKIPFGIFFLFSLIALSSFSSSKQHYFALILIHLFCGFLSFVFMILGTNYLKELLFVPDFVSRYLIPICSLGYVVLIYKRNQLED